MRWTIGQANQRFSELIRLAATEPQLICNRDRVVAAVIDADSAAKLEGVLERVGQRSVARARPSARVVRDFTGCGIALLDPFS